MAAPEAARVVCFKMVRLEKCVMGVKSNFLLIIYVNLKLGKVEIHTTIFTLVFGALTRYSSSIVGLVIRDEA